MEQYKLEYETNKDNIIYNADGINIYKNNCQNSTPNSTLNSTLNNTANSTLNNTENSTLNNTQTSIPICIFTKNNIKSNIYVGC